MRLKLILLIILIATINFIGGQLSAQTDEEAAGSHIVVASDGSGDYTDLSPCIDAGDPEVVDPDGTRSDIGVTGGNYAVVEN